MSEEPDKMTPTRAADLSRIRVRCPKCGQEIETSVPRGLETMVYCLDCRRWCREIDEGAAVLIRPRKGIRCH